MKNIYPYKSDVFNMQYVIDYDKLFNVQSTNKVIKSKKSFIKESNGYQKVHTNNMKNK